MHTSFPPPAFLPYNFGCRTRQAGIMERVLNAGWQENLNSCGHLPSSIKILFTEKWSTEWKNGPPSFSQREMACGGIARIRTVQCLTLHCEM